MFFYSKRYFFLYIWFDHAMKHCLACHNPNNVTKQIIDFHISNSWIRQFVIDVRVYKSYRESDHSRLLTKLTTPANKIARFRSHKSLTIPRYNTEALKINYKCSILWWMRIQTGVPKCRRIISYNPTFSNRNTWCLPRIFRWKKILPWDDIFPWNRTNKRRRKPEEKWEGHQSYDNNTIETNTKEIVWFQKHIESHFNPEHTKLKMPTEIKHRPICIWIFQPHQV